MSRNSPVIFQNIFHINKKNLPKVYIIAHITEYARVFHFSENGRGAGLTCTARVKSSVEWNQVISAALKVFKGIHDLEDLSAQDMLEALFHVFDLLP